jgi:hypothetical protein
MEATELASSYAISAREAAYRGDLALLKVHLAQLRLSTITALQTFKGHVSLPGSTTARAA